MIEEIRLLILFIFYVIGEKKEQNVYLGYLPSALDENWM